MKYHSLAPILGVKYFYQKPPIVLGKTQNPKHWKSALFFWYLYHMISYILVIFSLLRLIFKKKEHQGYTHNWQQRLSLQYPPFCKSDSNMEASHTEKPKTIWVHAVSVGETLAAAELIKQLLKSKHQILLTQTTPSAHDIAQKTFKEAIDAGNLRLQYFVYDCPYAVQTFLMHEKIDLTIIMETEFWPFLLAKLGELKIPTVLANARLSKKSWKKLRRFLPWFLPLYQYYDAICAQSDMDGKRFLNLLQNEYEPNHDDKKQKVIFKDSFKDKIKIMGNLKFDQNLNPAQIEKAQNFKAELMKVTQACDKKHILVFASTREGEEQILLQEWFKYAKNSPENAAELNHVLLWIVPRHLDRVSEIQNIIQSFKHQALLRTDLNIENLKDQNFNEKIIIGNSMGEMPFYMALADLVVMGGTWGDFGGQNFLEAIMQQKATIIGPSIYNFMQIAKNALKAGACTQASIEQMPALSIELLMQNKGALAHQQQTVYIRQQQQTKFMQSYAGVLKEYLAFLTKYLN